MTIEHEFTIEPNQIIFYIFFLDYPEQRNSFFVYSLRLTMLSYTRVQSMCKFQGLYLEISPKHV